ncbi:hypothetical protein ACT8ZV_06530 [Nocardioides sp. MAHUQ-72]|uniref:hypothetical protein n=1 Tax=unclassified Nocardioides TaxID=2615069 RepID=UPI003605CE88
MVERIFVHIGLPKTATSYLQTIIWSNRDRLREAGVVVPGAQRRDHLWASRTVRGDRHAASAPEEHRTAWPRMLAELEQSSGTGLVSHEFFAAASRKQARAMVEALPTPEVHLVVTAREPLGLFAASWQESLKNGETVPLPDYARKVSKSSNAIWNWRTLDLRLVLERWSAAVPPERIHVLVLDPTAPRDDVWRRFAGIVGFDPDSCDLSGSFPNTSMGIVEAEALRRINTRLEGFKKAFDKGVFIRTFLADERLVPRGGDRFWPEPDQIEECRRRAHDAVDLLAGGSFDVVGRLEHLLVPEHLEERRTADSVTDTEVADVALDLVAVMLGDVRRLRRRAAAEEDAESGLRSIVRRKKRRRDA